MALIQVSREDSAFMDNLEIASDNLLELLKDCGKLRDTFSDSDEELFEIVDDHIKLSRILEKLFALGDVIYCVRVFCITYVFCKEKATNNEENKVVGEMSFEVTKNLECP